MMRFIIERTSSHSDDGKKPCEEAYMGKGRCVDVRSFSNPETYNSRFKDNWFDVGTNHRIIDGKIARDLDPVDVFYIDINTVEELIELSKKYGDIIIGINMWDRDIPSLEIYDDYRE